MNRDKLTFRYFFNAGIDRITGICDAEGTDILYDGYYVGCIYFKHPSELAEMEDEELEEVFAENGILL